MTEEDLRKILQFKSIAVVGCSPKPERPSHFVAEYLQRAGYKIIPVNPGYQEILGEKCFPNLLEIKQPVDIVDIFRRSEQVYPIVQDAIKIKPKVIWMQDGIEHALAAEEAEKAGIQVVMDDCLMRVHHRLGGPFRKTITNC